MNTNLFSAPSVFYQFIPSAF